MCAEDCRWQTACLIGTLTVIFFAVMVVLSLPPPPSLPHACPPPSPPPRYDTPQSFTKLSADLSISMSVPDGDWALILTAPAGGVKGSVVIAEPLASTGDNSSSSSTSTDSGSSSSSDSAASPSSTPTSSLLTSFGGCAASDPMTECAKVGYMDGMDEWQGGRVAG